MNPRAVLPEIIIVVLLVSALPKSCPVGFADSVPKFSFESITASIHIQSPVHDGFYAGSFVSLNISIVFYTHAPALDSGEIPYQEVSCIYSLDDCEWKDVPLTSVRHQEFADPPNGGYWVKAFCTYGAAVSGLSEGQHFISVTVKPDEVLAYDALHPFYPFSPPPTRNALVCFTVRNTAGLSVLSPQNKTYESRDVPLIFLTDESAAGVAYSLDNQTNTAISGNATLSGLANGRHCLIVYANDTAGNYADSGIIRFSVAAPYTRAPNPSQSGATPTQSPSGQLNSPSQSAPSSLETACATIGAATIILSAIALLVKKKRLSNPPTHRG